MPAIPCLQIRQPPVVPCNHLPTKARTTMACHRPLWINSVGRIIDRQLLIRPYAAARNDGGCVLVPEVRIAAVISVTDGVRRIDQYILVDAYTKTAIRRRQASQSRVVNYRAAQLHHWLSCFYIVHRKQTASFNHRCADLRGIGKPAMLRDIGSSHIAVGRAAPASWLGGTLCAKRKTRISERPSARFCQIIRELPGRGCFELTIHLGNSSC